MAHPRTDTPTDPKPHHSKGLIRFGLVAMDGSVPRPEGVSEEAWLEKLSVDSRRDSVTDLALKAASAERVGENLKISGEAFYVADSFVPTVVQFGVSAGSLQVPTGCWAVPGAVRCEIETDSSRAGDSQTFSYEFAGFGSAARDVSVSVMPVSPEELFNSVAKPIDYLERTPENNSEYLRLA